MPAADAPSASAPAGSPAPSPVPTTACRNCEAPLPLPPPPYCAHCGQETRLRPPTLLEFAQQFGGAVLSTEGALWRTLKLLPRPGELTLRYFQGQRRRFVLPLRLYLTISVVVLLALRLSSSVGTAAPGGDALQVEPAANGTVQLGWARAGMADGRFFCEDLPDWVCQRLRQRLDTEPKVLARELRHVGERFLGNLGATMFVLLPAFALYLRLLYPRRGLHYTEHLVFALHVHAFWFLAIGVSLLPLPGADLAAALAIPLYGVLAMRRVYGGRWAPLLARASVLAVLHLATLLLSLVGLALWGLLA